MARNGNQVALRTDSERGNDRRVPLKSYGRHKAKAHRAERQSSTRNTKPKRNSLLTLNDCEVIAKVFGFANALELIGFAQTQQDKLDTKPAPMVAPQPQRDRGMVNGFGTPCDAASRRRGHR